MAGDEVADGGDGGLPALLGGPLPHGHGELPLGEGGAHHIGGNAGDGGARRIGDDERGLALGGQGRNGCGHGRGHDAEQKLHALAGDQLLSDALAGLGIGAVIAAHQLDLDARGKVGLMGLDVEVHPLVHLVALLGEEAGIGVDDADLDRLCAGGGRQGHRGHSAEQGCLDRFSQHVGFLPVNIAFLHLWLRRASHEQLSIK